MASPKTSLTACARSACRVGTRSRDPAHQGRLKPPEGVPGTAPMLARARERLPPAKLPEEPRQPGSERRSRAGRERRSSPKNTEARRPTELSEPAAESGRSRIPPPPPSHDPGKGTATPRFAVCRVDWLRRSRGPEAPERGVTHACRRSGAFAWQESVAPCKKTDKPKFRTILIFLCIDSVLFHKPPTTRPQSYPHDLLIL